MLPQRFCFVFLFLCNFDLFRSDRTLSVTWGIIMKLYPGTPPGTNLGLCQGTHHRFGVFKNVFLKTLVWNLRFFFLYFESIVLVGGVLSWSSECNLSSGVVIVTILYGKDKRWDEPHACVCLYRYTYPFCVPVLSFSRISRKFAILGKLRLEKWFAMKIVRKIYL